MRLRPARHGDLPAIRALLVAAQLPDEDIAAHLATLTAGEHRGSIAAAGALEPVGSAGLLRSIVVSPQTAADYYAGKGFKPVPRESAPAAVKNTRQFSGLCPATAVLIKLPIEIRKEKA